MALKGKDGVVFAVENIVLSKLYEPGCIKRVFNVDAHIGMVIIFSLYLPYIRPLPVSNRTQKPWSILQEMSAPAIVIILVLLSRQK